MSLRKARIQLLNAVTGKPEEEYVELTALAETVYAPPVVEEVVDTELN